MNAIHLLLISFSDPKDYADSPCHPTEYAPGVILYEPQVYYKNGTPKAVVKWILIEKCSMVSCGCRKKNGWKKKKDVI